MTNKHIEFPEAYDRAIKMRIIANAQKTFLKSGRNNEAYSFALENSHWNYFCKSSAEIFNRYGKLSVKQVDVLLNMKVKQAERNEAKEKELEANKLNSKHFGKVGERYGLRLTVVKHIEYYGQSFRYGDDGLRFISILSDEEGHEFKYFGNALTSRGFEKGNVLIMKATVKSHDEYKGMNATVISRPKVTKFIDDETGEKDAL